MISRYGPSESNVITPLAGFKALLGDKAEVSYSKGVDFRDSRFPGSVLLPEPPNEEEQDCDL